jgi:predicted tellurium resistance membrane protein TerC
MQWVFDPQIWIALATLTALEIVLGIDNIIFIAILTGKLKPQQQPRARVLGLGLAMIMRIGLLFSLFIIMRLTKPLFIIIANEISGRDIILILGGAFLLLKSTLEIHNKLEGAEVHSVRKTHSTFFSVIIQIMVLDIVFSFDSVITALGLAKHLPVMIAAIIIAVLFMMFFSGMISRFIENRPTLKILALSFLLLIGIALIGEGFDLHIPKGYIYFAMAFSFFVEMLNQRIHRSTGSPVILEKG